jgi:hypothetical protein
MAEEVENDKHRELCDRVLTESLEDITKFLVKVIRGSVKNEIFVKSPSRRMQAEVDAGRTPELGVVHPIPIPIGDRLYAVELFNRLVMTKVVPNERKKPLDSDSGRKLDVREALDKLSKELENGKVGDKSGGVEVS